MRAFPDRSLYVVVTEEYGKGLDAVEIARRAVAGGADIIQLREKAKSPSELLRIGRGMAAVCRSGGALFIVNDDPELARALGADGVHLGQEDARRVPLDEARRIVGPGRLIGLSTSTVDEVRAADRPGADYIAFGPVFPTAVKVKERAAGVAAAADALRATRKPLVCIGGIDLSNIGMLLDIGARHVAVIRAVIASDDIEARARSFKEALRAARGGDKNR